MKKRPHKILGIERNPDNIVRVADPIGTVEREELDFSALSSDQQEVLTGSGLRRLGENGGG